MSVEGGKCGGGRGTGGEGGGGGRAMTLTLRGPAAQASSHSTPIHETDREVDMSV